MLAVINLTQSASPTETNERRKHEPEISNAIVLRPTEGRVGYRGYVRQKPSRPNAIPRSRTFPTS